MLKGLAVIGFPKSTGSRKVARGLKRITRKKAEDTEMAKVRKRDKYCRFPLCGCKKFGLTMHVAHQRHRGMGGNPAGDRTDTRTMVYVCSARHRENKYSIDRGTIRWRGITAAGANGPIMWEVESARQRGPYTSGWEVVAIEKDIHIYEPGMLDVALKALAEMLT